MVDFLSKYSQNTWQLNAEMASYLLFGFAVAGFLHVLIKPEGVRKLLGKPGLWTVVKACLVGVPMPLCSCSVIPVAASLRKSGASRGATASFLSSTPQTGVDSIFATYALMGGPFTIVRIVVAFISGVVSGVLVDLFAKEQPPSPVKANRPLHPNSLARLNLNLTSDATLSFQSIATKSTISDETSCCTDSAADKATIEKALRYGFITLPAELATALLFGLMLGGLITTIMPDDLLSGALSSGPLAFLLATLISLPLYICATASIPLAYALISAGLSPGAALILLIVGPATNTATVVAVWKMLGRRATLIYIGCLVVIAWIAGAIFNSTISAGQMGDAIHHHENMQVAFWQHACGIALVGLFIFSILKKRLATQVKSNCCTD